MAPFNFSHFNKQVSADMLVAINKARNKQYKASIEALYRVLNSADPVTRRGEIGGKLDKWWDGIRSALVYLHALDRGVEMNSRNDVIRRLIKLFREWSSILASVG